MDLTILLAICIINLSLGAVIVFRDLRSTAARIFGLMTAMVTVWVISSFVTDNFVGQSLIVNDLANRVAYTTGLGAAIAGLWFTYHFPARHIVRRKEQIVVLIGAVILLLLSPSDFIAGAVQYGTTELIFTHGSLSLLYIAGIIGAIILIARNLIRSTRASSQNVRRQAHLIMAAFCITAFLGLLANVIIPMLGLNWNTTRIGPLSTLVFVGITAYAIVRHGLFDIRLAIIRTTTYVLSLATLTLVYFGLAISLSTLFFQSSQQVTHNPLNVILALILAFSFQPIKRFFDRLTNRIFFQDNYNSDDFFARLTDIATVTSDLRTLLERAATEISDTLKAEHGHFFVNLKDNNYMVAGTKGYSRISSRDVETLDLYVTEHDDAMISRDNLAPRTNMARLLMRHKIALILPLVRADRIIGYMSLGERRSNQYTTRDIQVIETVSDQLIIAIENALSVQEVKELNETLQQKIDEATKELRASNDQLQKLDEAKDEFVSMASHQLRTPLTSVKGYISMVLEGDAGKISDAQRHLLSEAFISSERMVHLINDFLNVSRLQTGKFMIDRRLVDLAHITDQEVASLMTTAKAHDLKLRYKKPTRFPSLYIDEGKIRQVIMNFIDNAIYYSSERSTITIGLEVNEGSVILTVHNEGMGVPKEEQSHLFTKFFRATNARKQRPDGTGVGLFLAKKVITEHGGSMVFESEMNKGATFGFRLPVKKLSTPPPPDLTD